MRSIGSIALPLALITAGCGGGSGDNAGGDPPRPAPTVMITGQLSGLRSPGFGLTLGLSTGEALKVLYDGTFSFTTPVAQGSAYQVSVRTQPSGPDQVCAVANGSGTVGSGNVVINVNCTTPPIVDILVANGTGLDIADGFVRGFVLDPTTGALTPKSVEAAPGKATTIAYRPAGQMLAITRFDTNNADFTKWGLGYQYSFDIFGVPKGQVLAGGADQIGFSPITGVLYGITPGSVSQRFPERFPSYKPGSVYPLSGPAAVRDPLAVPPLGRGLRRLAFDPSGATLFVTADGEGETDQRKIFSLSLGNPDAPTLVSAYPTSFAPFAIAARPSGRFLYVTAPASTLAYAFSYDAAGQLTPIGSSGFTAPPNARAVIMSNDGTRLYLASYDSGQVQCYAIGGDGTPVARGTPVTSGTRPVGMTFDPDGRFLYVLNRGEDTGTSTINGYVTGDDCSLTQIANMPVAAGSLGNAITSARFTP